jgi:pimeloyl-ACP methyl ester carboxylesterase
VIQGQDDEYGTMAQVAAISTQVAGPVEGLALPECRHSAHRDQPEAVLEAITEFVKKIGGNHSA